MTIDLGKVADDLRSAIAANRKPRQIVKMLSGTILESIEAGCTARQVSVELVAVLEKQGVKVSLQGIYGYIRNLVNTTSTGSAAVRPKDLVTPTLANSIDPPQASPAATPPDPDSLAAVTKPEIDDKGKMVITPPAPKEVMSNQRKVLSGTRRFVEPQIKTPNSK